MKLTDCKLPRASHSVGVPVAGVVAVVSPYSTRDYGARRPGQGATVRPLMSAPGWLLLDGLDQARGERIDRAEWSS